jgi:predicted O-linked N-acetylglucosamine transferase (SPINDLY family)
MSPGIANLVDEAVALRRAGDPDAARQRFEQALARDPRHPGALTSYAMLLLETGDTNRAIRLGRRAIAADPERMSAHHVLGQALCRSGRLHEGIATLRHAVALRPDAFDAQFHLGSALVQAGDLRGGERHLLQADDLAPETPAILVALGNLHRLQRRPADAIAAYRRALQREPRLAQAHGNLGTVLSEIGDADGAVAAFREAIALAPDHATNWSNLLLALDRSDHVSAADVAAAHRRYGTHFGARIRPLAQARVNPRAGRRIRLGYVSADFANHAVAMFFAPLLAHHDRTRFDVCCFHNRRTSDDMTDRIRALAEHFVPVADMSDRDLAQRIRAEEIDILVDLNGHTAHNRLPLFLLKPAPVQVTWLGYLATTGLATMDYRLTDARVDPPGLTESWHTEALWRLPDSLWCYQPYDFAPDVGPSPARENGYVTFACLNNPGKVSDSVIALWGRILAALPSSRMLLVTSAFPERVAALDRLFGRQGVAPGRVEHLPPRSTPDYLALYNRSDIALDTWPYAGGTTTCDALWMGVPVVTLAGDRSFSRAGASVLHAAGLPEQVADTPDAYVERALALARDPRALAAMRASLRDRVRASPLTDAARFARAIEAAFAAMVDRLR